MARYCTYCGAQMADSALYCPSCGAAVATTEVVVDNGADAGGGSGISDVAKTAAVVGGTILGATALNDLTWRMTHRRRPHYCAPRRPPPPPPGPRHGGPGGHGGHGGPGGPSGGRRGGPGGPGRR